MPRVHVRSHQPWTPARGADPSVIGIAAWSLLAFGVILLLATEHATVGLFAAVLGLVGACHIVERASGRRHGYVRPARRC